MKLCQKVEPRTAEEMKLSRCAAASAFVLLILDQLTKLVVEHHMELGESIPVIKGFFSLTYVTNLGAAWGIFHGYGMVLFAIGVAVLLLALRFLRKLADGYSERYFAILTVLSGVVGNSIDRVWRGAVVDFLDCYIGKHHWPAFNVADCAICIGIGIYALSVLLRPEPEKTVASDRENAA